MSDVVVVGSINADLVFQVAAHPVPGETVLGQSMLVLPGGKGANQAVCAAKLGSHVAMVGAVGNDAFAASATGTMRSSGVALDAVSEVSGATGVAAITLSSDGENSIVVVPGANAAVDAAMVNAHAAQIAAAPVVVVQGEIPRAGIEAAAHATKGRLLLNLAPVVEVDPAVIRQANPLVVNEHEALGALAILGGTADPSDHVGIAKALLAAGVPSVVITLGSAGALVGDAAGVTAVAAPKVKAVDTTGAGDAFVGALAHGLANGESLQTAAQYAVKVGAYAVTS